MEEKELNADNELLGALNALEKDNEDIKDVTEEVKEPEPVSETEVEVAETESTVEKPVDEEDHGEKSRLGRKVKRIEERFSTVESKIDTLLTKIQQPASEKTEQEEEFELSEYPTADELKKFKEYTVKKAKEAAREAVSEERNAQKTEASKYETEYLALFKTMVEPDDEDDDISGELKKLMLDSKFNVKHSNNATQDFLTNYRNATDFLLRKTPVRTPNVHGKTSTVASGLPKSNTAKKVVQFDRAKLSPLEAQLAADFSDEELAGMGL